MNVGMFGRNDIEPPRSLAGVAGEQNGHQNRDAGKTAADRVNEGLALANH